MRVVAVALILAVICTTGPKTRAASTGLTRAAPGEASVVDSFVAPGEASAVDPFVAPGEASAVHPFVAQDFSPASPASSPTIRIGIARGNSYEVTTIPLETYVARVLAGEALPGSAPAALDALAIAVRTYTLANLGRHRADGFDLCDQTHCQVMRTSTSSTERAAQTTAGKALLYRGAPATVYYSASCGGRTEIPSAVWPGAEDPPYLPSRPDDGCGGDPAWTAELALTDLRRSLQEAGFRGTLRAMRVASRNSSGRVATLALDGLSPSEISGQDLRVAVGETLGWQHIRSTAFELRRIGDAYRFDGHGSGHGVGMCVIGSAKLAAAGESATAILNRYFPGVEIGLFVPRSTAAPDAAPPAAPLVATSPVPIAAPPVAASPVTAPRPSSPVLANAAAVLVSLPQGDEGQRDAILALASRARDDLAKALGVPAPPSLTLRFHATTDDYARATGRAWFTSGAVVTTEIHLAPLASLRERGVLERTIRRQVAHVLVDDALGRRPAWVREGAALFYADGDAATPAGLARTSCPTDAELLQPVSAGALTTAYAEARACFARQIASGRTWRDVR